MEKAALNDCFLHDKDRLTHHQALQILADVLPTVTEAELVPLNAGSGRILAQDVTAPHAVPLHTNSAVDGYAFRHEELQADELSVSQKIAAGDLSPPPLEPATAARIFTGATMPAGADTVAMQEDCTETEGKVKIPSTLKLGSNCRLAGEDLKEGDVLLRTGHRLSPRDIAAAASIGASKLHVSRKLRVTLFSTGDEMRRAESADKPLQTGEVWDANAPLLASALEKLPVELIVGDILPDDQSEVENALREAARNSDLIITSGGASRGDEDHMIDVLARLGKRHLWQLAVKPGRPMLMGQINRLEYDHDCFFIGLPGNPVAAYVCFLLYARTAVLRLCGATKQLPAGFQLAAGFTIANKKPDRREFIRGILSTDEQGNQVAEKFHSTGSGLISSLRLSDGLIEIPEEVTELEAGTPVTFIPYTSFD